MSAKQIYQNINKKAFWATLIISIVLILTSFFLPPTGEISPTVMAAVGELFAFATLGTVIVAIEQGKTITLNKGDVNVTVGDNDGNEPSV